MKLAQEGWLLDQLVPDFAPPARAEAAYRRIKTIVQSIEDHSDRRYLQAGYNLTHGVDEIALREPKSKSRDLRLIEATEELTIERVEERDPETIFAYFRTDLVIELASRLLPRSLYEPGAVSENLAVKSRTIMVTIDVGSDEGFRRNRSGRVAIINRVTLQGDFDRWYIDTIRSAVDPITPGQISVVANGSPEDIFLMERQIIEDLDVSLEKFVEESMKVLFSRFGTVYTNRELFESAIGAILTETCTPFHRSAASIFGRYTGKTSIGASVGVAVARPQLEALIAKVDAAAGLSLFQHWTDDTHHGFRIRADEGYGPRVTFLTLADLPKDLLVSQAIPRMIARRFLEIHVPAHSSRKWKKERQSNVDGKYLSVEAWRLQNIMIAIEELPLYGDHPLIASKQG